MLKTLLKRTIVVLFLLAILPISQVYAQGDTTRTFSVSERTVMQAYIAYYGRPADPAGLAYWAGRLDNEGGSLVAIINAFGESLEFNARFGTLSTSELVTNIYQQLFNREPDSGGRDYYIEELETGRKSLQSITLDVLYGSQNDDSTIIANKLEVANYFTYQLELGRSVINADEDWADLLVNAGLDVASIESCCNAIEDLLEDLPQSYCDSSNLDLCLYSGICTAIGGYWYDDSCNESQLDIPQSTCENIAGTWSSTSQVDSRDCGEGYVTEYGSYTLTQSGCDITVQDNTYGGIYYSTVNDNTASWTGSYSEDGGTTTDNITLTFSGNTMSGSSTWTWSGYGESCSGTSQISGTIN